MCILCDMALAKEKGDVTADQQSAEIALNDDDFGQDAQSAGAISIGQTIDGSLEVIGDRDWLALDLEEGQGIQIDVTGSSLQDPYLRVYDAAGTVLAFNDDTNGFNPQVAYTAASTQTIYIEVASWEDRMLGFYQVAVSEAVPPGPETSIDWGSKLYDPTVNVYFAQAGYSGADGNISDGWNSYEIAQAQKAMDLIEAACNLTFTTVTSDATADFIMLLDTNGDMAAGQLGYFYPPLSTEAGLGGFNGAEWDRSPGGDLEEGGEGFVTLVHEMLHGVGLAHPHDEGGSSVKMNGVSAATNNYGVAGLNQGIYTTMSYNSGMQSGDIGATSWSRNFGNEAGPMALDIAVLQEKYGANTSTNSGNDIYALPGSNGSGTSWKAIWDAGGVDELRYQGANDSVLDLREATLKYAPGGGGYASAASGIAGGYTIAKGAIIENATAGDGNDKLVGNYVANRLIGGLGSDSLEGGAGDDTLDGGLGGDLIVGGTGRDLADYSGYSGTIRVNLNVKNAQNTVSGGMDTLLEIEDILGGAYNDRLVGRPSDSHLEGGAGADKLIGIGGADLLEGGIGQDTLLGGNDNDTLAGGDDRDLLFAGNGRDHLEGGAGRDYLQGQSGADTLIGGEGRDILVGGSRAGNFGGDGAADVFAFTDIGQSTHLGAGRDVVRDFEQGIDLFDLSAIDAIGASGANDSFTFIGSDRFSGTAGELRSFTGHNWTLIKADSDGDGHGEFAIRLNGVYTLTADDFIL